MMVSRRIKHISMTILIIHVIVAAIYFSSSDRSINAATQGVIKSSWTNVDINHAESLSSVRQDVTVTGLKSTVLATVSWAPVITSRINEESPPTKSEAFQSIDDKEAWMYSAFYDHVAAQDGKPRVRLFGVILNSTHNEVHCAFIFEDKHMLVPGTITAFEDSHDKIYLPSYLECPLPKNMRPTHVSISFQTKDKPTNRFQILYPGPRIRNFTVCYSVLHSGYNNPTQLIESIEMNRILGAEHFMVYNYSISPAVDQILRRYHEDGLVTVLQWQIPTLESWYFSQMSLLNDCFYRNRNVSRFVVVVDTDEHFVLKNHSTFMELINSVSPQESDISQFMNPSTQPKNGHNLTGCFMVRSSFFTNDWRPNWSSLPSQFTFEDKEKENVVKYWMVTLTQFWRQNYIFLHEVKSKYIARPELVYTSLIHLVKDFTSPNTCLHISENQALLHHYRVPNMKNDLVIDTDILKFKATLYPRVMDQIKRFPKIFN